MPLKEKPIKTWKEFRKKVRDHGYRLLDSLDGFPESILVCGCQRSGTTVLTRVIRQAESIEKFQYTKDDELDAALILNGRIEPNTGGRFCFQTTYLNENYSEYFDHISGHKIIWVIRNPFSNVYSMLYHWKRWALNELFVGCGVTYLESKFLQRYKSFGLWAVPTIYKACAAYISKMSQLEHLAADYPQKNLFVVDYDRLVQDNQATLQAIFDFAQIEYKSTYGRLINNRSIKKALKLNAKEKNIISDICLAHYETVRQQYDHIRMHP